MSSYYRKRRELPVGRREQEGQRPTLLRCMAEGTEEFTTDKAEPSGVQGVV